MTQTTQYAHVGRLAFEPIPAAELDAIGAAGRDEAGNLLEVRVLEDSGAPLRCCLREARAGERVLLIAYTPPGTAGAYAERGPVFIHAERCAGYPTPAQYPPGLAHRQQVVRAYDRQGRIADGVTRDLGLNVAKQFQAFFMGLKRQRLHRLLDLFVHRERDRI